MIARFLSREIERFSYFNESNQGLRLYNKRYITHILRNKYFKNHSTVESSESTPLHQHENNGRDFSIADKL